MKRPLRVGIYIAILVGVPLAVYFAVIRLQTAVSGNGADYRARIELSRKELSAREGDAIVLRVRLTNTGRKPWTSAGPSPVVFSYHLFDEQGETIRHDNRRFPLPEPISPGKSTALDIRLLAPLTAGIYLLEFDLVREGAAWFKDEGSPTAFATLTVEEKTWPDSEVPMTLSYGRFTRVHSSVPEFNALFKLIRLTLEKNAVQFDGKTGRVYGFSAGTEYPQVWLRDAATILWASRYFYGQPYLVSWLEEHLAYQREDGSLVDWFDSRGRADKNTTETDQEASAVQAAYDAFQILGDGWLQKKISGTTILDRLEKALLFVRNSRWDEELGLVIGAHTADWGDVDIVDPDQKAIYVDARTHWTADIYDQSMFFEACLNLADMLEAAGDEEKAELWRKTARTLRANTNRWLWQDEKGFFRVHIHLDSMEHDFDEGNMFAMGGNTLAVLSGLASEQQARRIIHVALRRQEAYRVSTISGTLLPPYPRGLFKHPLCDDPYEYQNGAQWDWFGGRLVYAMFTHGFSQRGREKLLEIARKNIGNRGFFEWDTREGAGRGSPFFAGSTGSLAMALIQGYFGITLGKEGLTLEPRLGRDSGEIHVDVPAGDLFAAYIYDYDHGEDRIRFAVNSNSQALKTVRLLNLWRETIDAGEARPSLACVWEEGKKAFLTRERKGEDELLVLEITPEEYNQTLEAAPVDGRIRKESDRGNSPNRDQGSGKWRDSGRR